MPPYLLGQRLILYVFWGLVSWSGEVLVATTAATAFGDHKLLAVLGEIVEEFASVPVVNNGTDGNLDDMVFARFAGFVRTFAVATALGGMFGIHAQVKESVVVSAAFKNDVAAVTAIAAAGTATRDEFLAPECRTAVTAVAAIDVDFGFVDEF